MELPSSELPDELPSSEFPDPFSRHNRALVEHELMLEEWAHECPCCIAYQAECEADEWAEDLLRWAGIPWDPEDVEIELELERERTRDWIENKTEE